MEQGRYELTLWMDIEITYFQAAHIASIYPHRVIVLIGKQLVSTQ
jgi:hypothetical protein